MALDYRPLSDSELVSLEERMRDFYSTRNNEYGILRDVFKGNFLQDKQTNALGAGEFLDTRSVRYNYINTTTRRYMDEMSAPIQILCHPRGRTREDNDLAERKSLLLKRIFKKEKMLVKMIEAGGLQSLFDSAVWHVRPAPHRPHKIAIELVVPESYFPIPSTDRWQDQAAVITSWTAFDPINSLGIQDSEGDLHKAAALDAMRNIEYWDHESMVRLDHVRGEKKRIFERRHGWGQAPFIRACNIPIHGQQRHQGDSDQIIGLNEALNSSLTDAINVHSYLANPIVVIRGSIIGQQNPIFAPRAVWNVERDGSVELLTWAGQPPSNEALILKLMQAMEDSTGLNSPAMGRDIPSGVSGDAIRSILAGFSTRVGTKQSLMGFALSQVCELILLILEKEYPNEIFELPGEGGFNKGVKIQPKEFRGFYDTQIIYEPQNEGVRVFSEIQKLDKGIQSRRTTMLRLGVYNPEDESARILEERQVDVAFDIAKSSGGRFGPPGVPLLPGAQPPPGINTGRDFNMEGIEKAVGASDAGTLADLLGGDKAAALGRAGPGAVDLEDIQNALRGVDVSGKAFIEGSVVDEGKADDTFVVRIENAEDEGAIREALGAMAGRAQIQVGLEGGFSAPRVRVGRRR